LIGKKNISGELLAPANRVGKDAEIRENKGAPVFVRELGLQ